MIFENFLASYLSFLFLATFFIITISIVIILIFVLKKFIKEFDKLKIVTNQNKDNINQVEIISKDGNIVSLNKILEDSININIDDYIEITNNISTTNLTISSVFSSMLSTSIQTGGIKLLNPTGFFKATIAPNKLTPFNDGTLSTMVHGEKGIIGHHGFISSSSSVFAPIIIFQILSAVTAQYYLNGITKQLDTIDRKINKLIQVYHIERLSKIRNAVKTIKRIYNIKHPNIEDMVSLKMIENDLGIIYEEYLYQITGIDIDFVTKTHKFFTNGKLKELETKVYDTNFDFNFNMVISSNELLHLIKFVELSINTKLKDNLENRSNRTGEILEEIETWDNQDFFEMNKNKNFITEFYSPIFKKIVEIYKKEIFKNKKVNQVILDINKKQSELNDYFNSKSEVMEIGRRLLEEFKKPVDVIYYFDKTVGDKIFIKNQ